MNTVGCPPSMEYSECMFHVPTGVNAPNTCTEMPDGQNNGRSYIYIYRERFIDNGQPVDQMQPKTTASLPVKVNVTVGPVVFAQVSVPSQAGASLWPSSPTHIPSQRTSGVSSWSSTTNVSANA